MGGKRISGRSTSGKHMQPRISSGGSTKSSIIESPSATKELLNNDDEPSEFHPRKNSFDIISLLESHGDTSEPLPGHRETESFFSPRNGERRLDSTTGLPSFWHFVEPPETSKEIFHTYQHHKGSIPQHINHQKFTSKRNTSAAILQYPSGNKIGNPTKRMLKRRKVKKAQSAKVAGFKALEQSPERLQREGVEWLRVLTPPGSDTSSMCDADNDDDDDDDDEDDELIKRYFSGLSSAGSSISWAEDAMESEFTSQLMKLWEDIEAVCRGADRTEKMSDLVYNECLQWKRAFPDPDLHRFSKNENGDVSPLESPIFEDERGDAQFSSLVHSSRFDGGSKVYLDDSVNLLQARFRSLNCATPRPNIEKSTEYVSAWLSECQNSTVPDVDQRLLDYKSRPSSTSASLKNPLNNFSEDVDPRIKSRYNLRAMSNITRSSCAHYSRSHAKFVAEPDPENFFTSLAITSNENYASNSLKLDSLSTFGETQLNCGSFGYSCIQSRIHESDEEDEDSRASPSSLTEIVSFRPNVRVQRPISSRIRDHTITPIATGSYAQASTFSGARQYGINLNRQTVVTPSLRSNSLPNPQGTENYRVGRMGMFDNNTNTNASSYATPDFRGGNRIQSGLAKYGNNLPYYGRSRQLQQQQQAPWSRHTGDDLAVESNYVTSLYENYQVGVGGSSGEGINTGSKSSLRSTELKSPDSGKNGLITPYSRNSLGVDGPSSIPECEDQSFQPVVSWLMNRVSPH